MLLHVCTRQLDIKCVQVVLCVWGRQFVYVMLYVLLHACMLDIVCVYVYVGTLDVCVRLYKLSCVCDIVT